VGPDGKVALRPIILDRAIGNQWLVTSGLDVGDKVIIEGSQKAMPGAAVKAIPSEQAEAARPAAGPVTPPAASAK